MTQRKMRWLCLLVFVSVYVYNMQQKAIRSTQINALTLPPAEVHEAVSPPISFPPDCTWQCYIRQNEDLLQALPWNENAAIQHYQRYGVRENRNCACKVLILAGPHKAASTSLQSTATIFSDIDNIQWHWLSGDPKGFAIFPPMFYGQPLPHVVPTFDTVRENFRNEIQDKYNQGYNIILGSEEIDRVTKEEEQFKNNTIIDEIINILPKKVREHRYKHLLSIVVYRAPRSSHLKSVWVEMQDCMKQANVPVQSFKQYICSAEDRGLEGNFSAIDSLALTKILLQKGIAVKLFDMMSLDENNGKSLISMLGCDMMGLSCTADKTTNQIIPVAIDQHTEKKNIMERLMTRQNRGMEKLGFKSTDQLKMFDIFSNEQILQIDELMNKYDCAQYAEMMKYKEKLELLIYDDKKSMLNDNMRKCKNYTAFRTSHHQVVQSIKAIVGCDKD